MPTTTSDAGPPGAVDGPAILGRQERRESAARTYARSVGIVPVAARGAEVRNADGRTYLDCLGGAGTLALGHNHPEVVAAIRDTLDRGTPLHALDLATPEKDDLTTELLGTMPGRLRDHGRVHFCGPTGADAVEAAIKLCHTATGRSGLLTFTGAFHGMTLGALAATGERDPKAAVPSIRASVTRLPYPYDLRCPFGVGGEAGARLSVTYAERLLDDPGGGVLPPAAMLLEPVQGEGGVIPAPPWWLAEMRRITRERGIPLILDEVQSGVGRTGTTWAFEAAGVVPDAVVCAKAIGGSLPLAVVVYDEDLDVWEPGAHTGTFRGTTLAMAAGAQTLRILRRDGLAARAGALGERLLAGLRELGERHASVGEARGRGLMLGLELVDPAGEPDALGVRPASPERARAVRAAAREAGVIVELGGRHGAVVRLLPPLVLTDDQADAVVAALDGALHAAERTAGGVQGAT